MKAIILAAGNRKRFGDIDQDMPRCLVKINGRSILEYQLSVLSKFSFKEIVLVTGYQAQMIKSAVNGHCTILFNDLYEITQSIYSLWLAKDQLKGQEFVLLNSDIMAQEELFNALIKSKNKTAVLVDNSKPIQTGATNVVIRDGKVVKIGKYVKGSEAAGASAQIIKFAADDSRLLFERIKGLIAKGYTNRFPEAACDVIFQKSTMWPVFTGGKKWFDIDSLSDLVNCQSSLER